MAEPTNNSQKRVRVDFQPLGRRIEIDQGSTLLEASQQAGVQLVSLCGGSGSCEGCIVRVVAGEVTDPTSLEQAFIESEALASGFRQACQAHALSDITLDVPPESLSTNQRLQLETQTLELETDPIIAPIDVELDAADLKDLRSDLSRVHAALSRHKISNPIFRLSLLKELSNQLRASGWSVRLALRGSDVVGVLHSGSPLFGIAVDIGTTKLAVYLLDLATGIVVAKAGEMNPQIAYGEDVINRIAYATTHENGRQTLQDALIATLNSLIQRCCSEADISADQIVDAVVVGNTAMHHLFSGLPVRQLGVSPFVPSVGRALDIEASQVGLAIASGAYVHLPPNIAGYVGADHVAMLLASEAWTSRSNILALDIGTNTEITLATGGRLLTCSCASGPAFEGAHIRDGMRAAPGAIERVQIEDGLIRLQTVDGQPAVGICGSGVVDTVAELLEAGALDHTGRMNTEHALIRQGAEHSEICLLEAGDTGHGRDIVVTRKDVNEIQLAKAAIRTGQEILLRVAALNHEDIDEVRIAGAFGTYLDVRSAVRLGMLPSLPLDRFRQVGNAAGAGAIQMLLSAKRRLLAAEISDRIEYVELTTQPDFQSLYAQSLHL
jgi:uncharacterized 2Fe-2S/4Fe-4S cluster protein (DUF4445 family)